jgi:uncharacterized protein YjbI with pentapeptide repeats
MSDPTKPEAQTVEQRLAALERQLETQAKELESYASLARTQQTADRPTQHERSYGETMLKVLELIAVFGGVGVGIWTIREAKHQYIETHSATMKQLELAREQNDKLQVQIDAQREQDYIARRADLLATLYDRKENCEAIERASASCPHKASRRSREEALRAFAAIEHARTPPALSLRALVLPDASLAGLDLRDADLTGAELDHSDLEAVLLQRANLRGASLVRTNLHRANLDQANLDGADLASASLASASLRHAELTTTHFDDTDLEHADLTGAHMRADALLTNHRNDRQVEQQSLQFEWPAPMPTSDPVQAPTR